VKIAFAGKVPKDFKFPESNEDTYAISLDYQRIALSDGASESFDSRSWANLLVRNFVINPALDETWLSHQVQEYAEQHDVENMSWSKQASFERGSFATLIGVEFSIDHKSIDVLCIGDSLAVFLDGSDYVDSFTYTLSSHFKQRPELLCTAIAHNSFLNSADFFTRHHKTWMFAGKKSPRLLCMTDALAEWALKAAEEGSPKWAFLCSISNESELSEFINDARERKVMRTDDSTLIHVDLSEMEAYGLSNT
jgi:hypothetical protein